MGRNAKHRTYKSYRTHIENAPPEAAANTILCLFHQANDLLDRQLRELERRFLKEGGLRERMTRARLGERMTRARLDERMTRAPSSNTTVNATETNSGDNLFPRDTRPRDTPPVVFLL